MKTVCLIVAFLATATLANQDDTQDITFHQVPKHITRRQIYRDDVKYMKGQVRPVGTDDVQDGPYKPQDYQPSYEDEYRPGYKPEYPADYESYKPSYGPNNYEENFYGHGQKYPEYKPDYDRPYSVPEGYGTSKPYGPKPKPKPKPSYPKDVVLLQPGPALKPTNVYADQYDGYRPSSVPGTPGKDYPNYTAVPNTSFDCLRIKDPSYEYMYPDTETGCQVFHQCHADGRQDSFLCPLGTIFDGETQTCDWWFNARCY